jgi:sortase A
VIRRSVGVIGELLLTAGVVVLLFAAYVTWGTGAVTAAAQDRLRDDLAEDWSVPVEEAEPRAKPRPIPEPELGEGFAVMTIPGLGEGWQYVVVEGVYLENLREGPGHYPTTALPGQRGNFAVAGHRTTYGAPFHQIDTLEPGDRIIVDTRNARHIYRVTEPPLIIAPSDTWVVNQSRTDPVQRARQRLITLTSCHPKWSAAQRIVAGGKLVRTIVRDAGDDPTDIVSARPAPEQRRS